MADEPVQIVASDATWQARFEAERKALAGVRDLADSRACFEPLAELGYLYAPYRASEMHWFCKPHPSRRTHHLHLVPTDSARFREELAFRDHLRSHPATAAEYAALKRPLAVRFEDGREAYTDAKAEFIRGVLARAG
jgi:GrpB-like predicted nucleotidyltransferase (UPF0157 family)